MNRRALDVGFALWALALVVAFALGGDWLGSVVVGVVAAFGLAPRRSSGTEVTRLSQLTVRCLQAGIYYGVIAGGTFNLMDGEDFRPVGDLVLGLAFGLLMTILMSIVFLIHRARQRRQAEGP